MSRKRRIGSLFRNTQTASPAYRDMEYYRIETWQLPNPGRWPLYPAAVEETRRRVPFWYEEKFSHFSCLSLLFYGRISYRTDGKKFLLEPGKVLLLPLEQSYFFESKEPYHKLVLELRGEHLSSLTEALGLRTPRLFSPADMETIITEFRRIESMLREPDEAEIPELMSRCYRLLHMLALEVREKTVPSKRLAQAKSLLENRLEEPFSLSELAARLGVSPATVTRLFRSSLGVSPQQYRIARKIEAACEYLQHTELSVKEIAYRLGYCTQFYFTAEFRRATGATPTRYRDRIRKTSGK